MLPDNVDKVVNCQVAGFWMGSVGDLYGHLGSVSYINLIMYKYSGLVIVKTMV